VGWEDCDGDLADGCEANVGADSMNCGSCSTVCEPTAACVAGACESMTGGASGGAGANGAGGMAPEDCGVHRSCLGACDAGWADCDALNGCETNLESPTSCGRCGNTCFGEEVCFEGECQVPGAGGAGGEGGASALETSPCTGLCDDWTRVLAISEGYKVEQFFTTAEVCYEVEGYFDEVVSPNEPTIVCWNFAVGRSLEVNGEPVTCSIGGVAMPAPRVGGYCVHASAGDYEYAGFLLPFHWP
jgi:hypothetical protein